MYCVELRFDQPTLGFKLEKGRKKGLHAVKFEDFVVTLHGDFGTFEDYRLYAGEYSYQVSLMDFTDAAEVPPDQPQVLLAHGAAGNEKRARKYLEPRPLRLWEGRVSPRRNGHGHAQLIPPASAGSDTLLVNVLATEAGRQSHTMFTLGTVQVSPTVRIHESYPKIREGRCRQALLTLSGGDEVAMHRYQFKGDTTYRWEPPYLYLHRVMGRNIHEERFHIPDLIDAEKAADNAAYAATADLSKKYEFIF